MCFRASCLALLLLLSTACRGGSPEDTAEQRRPAPNAPGGTAAQGPARTVEADETFVFGAYDGAIVDEEGQCVVVLVPTNDEGAEMSLRSDLRPPCHVLRWSHERSARPSSHGGAWIGTVGDPKVWRREKPEPISVLIFNGDPKASLTDAEAAEYHDLACGERTQAILLESGVPKLSPRTVDMRTCGEGPDEIEYWMYSESLSP